MTVYHGRVLELIFDKIQNLSCISELLWYYDICRDKIHYVCLCLVYLYKN